MQEKTKMQKCSTIFTRTCVPILAMLIVILGLYTVILRQNVLTYLRENAAVVFNESVVNRKLYVENEMTSQWTAIDNNVETVTLELERIVQERGESLGAIESDPALNQAILSGVMDELVGALRTCGATEIFLVLDGPATQQEDMRAGVYLRNMSPDFYSKGNENLLFERGMPALSKQWRISLDSFWTAGFQLKQGDPNSAYFFEPLQAARNSDNTSAENFAYWCYSYPIHTSDHGILSYSIPLIASDGTVVGVMGVGVSEDHFSKTMDYTELGGDHTGAYVLAKTTDAEHYEPIIYNGTSYSKSTLLSKTFTLHQGPQSPLTYLDLETAEPRTLCASVQKLRLYNNNTPFEHEQWVLIGIQSEQVLLDTYTLAQRTLLILAMIGLALSAAGAYWISRMIAAPIRRLVEQLRKSDPNRPIQLERQQVEEVDVLAGSIEALSARVAAAFSSVSTAMQMSGAGIGMYEYKVTENLVFCSLGLYELLGWPAPEQEDTAYVDATDFRCRMQGLEQYLRTGSEELLELPQEDGTYKWLRVKQTQRADTILGVLTDVTASIEEKQHIEYERDYDILTHIYNRRAFESRIPQFFEDPDQLKFAAVIVWDLDNLKFVNDTYGHTMGDAYIISLAQCLERAGNQQISARRSGDEFITLVYGCQSEQNLEDTVQSIWNRTQSAKIDLPTGKQMKTRVSAGMSRYPQDATEFGVLFQYADFAMYTAKNRRKGTLERFDPTLYAENRILLQGQEEFNNLVDKRLVRYILQPIVLVKDAKVYGYEMLLRPNAELFKTPLDVLRMAHAQSKLYDIEVMTWFESMKTFVQLQEYGLLEPGCKVFINSIANQLLQPDMIRLFDMSFKPHLKEIVCEFTEEERYNLQLTQQKTQLMRHWGAMVAIDDYGCGYNGEAILLDVQPDIVKIDINIMRNIHQDPDRQGLVRNLVKYAHERNILVLGEGVECKEEMQASVELGIDLLQGFYVAVPTFDGAGPTDAVRAEIAQAYETVQARTDKE